MNKIYLPILLSLFVACSSVPQAPVRESVSSASHQTYRVAAAQFLIEANQTQERFFDKVEALVRQAANQKSDLIVLPELLVMDVWPVGSKIPSKERARTLAVELTPKYFVRVTELSAQYNIAILAGSAPRLSGAEIFNTALMVFPDGRKIYQDKVFLTQWEKDQGWTPGKTVRVFDAPWGRSTILICFDSEFPLVSQLLAKHQPEWIFVPSMTESLAGLNRVRWSVQARAVEHHAFVVVAGTVGQPTKDWAHHGEGLLLEPWGGQFNGIVSEGRKDEPGLVSGQFDREALRAGRASSHYFPAKEQQSKGSVTVEVVH